MYTKIVTITNFRTVKIKYIICPFVNSSHSTSVTSIREHFKIINILKLLSSAASRRGGGYSTEQLRMSVRMYVCNNFHARPYVRPALRAVLASMHRATARCPNGQKSCGVDRALLALLLNDAQISYNSCSPTHTLNEFGDFGLVKR